MSGQPYWSESLGCTRTYWCLLVGCPPWGPGCVCVCVCVCVCARGTISRLGTFLLLGYSACLGTCTSMNMVSSSSPLQPFSWELDTEERFTFVSSYWDREVERSRCTCITDEVRQ